MSKAPTHDLEKQMAALLIPTTEVKALFSSQGYLYSVLSP